MIGIIGADSPPCGLNVSHEIWNTWQSTSPDLRKSDKLDTSINRQLTNNLVASPIFTEVIGDKLSDISRRDIYMCCRMNFIADPIDIPAPQFVDLGLSAITAMDKGASLWTPLPDIERLRIFPMGACSIIFF